jgi:hypothetical protein
MNDYDVSRSEMRRLGNIDDSDLDAMREGHALNDDPSKAGIARFVRDLGEAFPEPSTADLEDAHVAAMTQVAHLMAEKGELVARPASKAYGPAHQASGLPKPWREAIMSKMKWVFATRAAKVTAVAVAMLLAFSGVAVAGVLPAPVQNKVADAVATIGVDIPGGTDEAQAGDIDQGNVNDVDQPDAGNVDQPDSGNIDQPAANDSQVDVNNADQPNAGNSDNSNSGDGQN